MGQIIIDDPHGFETRFSTQPESIAAPYIRRYLPQRLEDLYDIGVIPKHVPLDDLRKAREVGLKAGVEFIGVTSRSFAALPLESRKQYVEASSKTKSQEIAVRATAQVLASRHGYSLEHADMLARKAHTFDDRVDVNAPIPFFSVALADDLIVRTPLVIDASIDGLTAKAVVIHQAGEIRAEGRYFLLRCDSFQGEGDWFRTSPYFNPSNKSMGFNRHS